MPNSILVVDDQMIIALDIQTQLLERGHTVHLAPSHEKALRLLDQVSIDVAIIDGHAGTAALELAHQLRERHIPYVVCSGASSDEVLGLFGGVPFVPKPFAPAELVAAVDGAICGRETLH